MRLGIAGTGKIVEDALYAIEPIREIAVNAIFARPHSREKGEYLFSHFSRPLFCLFQYFVDVQSLIRRQELV